MCFPPRIKQHNQREKHLNTRPGPFQQGIQYSMATLKQPLSLSLFGSQEYQEKHQHSQFASSKINTSAFFENSIVSCPTKTDGRKVSSPSLLGSLPPHHRLLPASGFFSSQWRMPRYSLVASWRVKPATLNKVGGPRNPSNLHMLTWLEIEFFCWYVMI